MIPALAGLALKFLPVKAWLKAHAALVIFAIVALALVGSSVFLYQRGHNAGASEEKVRVERVHTETIREVRSDEKLAQDTADQIGQNLTQQIADQRATTDATLKEIQDELAKRPAPAANAVVDVVGSNVLAASNALVDRANRAASPPEPAR